jgi:hypothetical protein
MRLFACPACGLRLTQVNATGSHNFNFQILYLRLLDVRKAGADGFDQWFETALINVGSSTDQ